jgi:hypothetical protein
MCIYIYIYIFFFSALNDRKACSSSHIAECVSHLAAMSGVESPARAGRSRFDSPPAGSPRSPAAAEVSPVRAAAKVIARKKAKAAAKRTAKAGAKAAANVRRMQALADAANSDDSASEPPARQPSQVEVKKRPAATAGDDPDEPPARKPGSRVDQDFLAPRPSAKTKGRGRGGRKGGNAKGGNAKGFGMLKSKLAMKAPMKASKAMKGAGGTDGAGGCESKDQYNFRQACKGLSRDYPEPPEHVKKQLQDIKAGGRNSNKAARMREMLLSWKVDPTWGGHTFNQTRAIEVNDTHTNDESLYIWGEIVGKHGGSLALALESLQSGDVVCVHHPRDATRVMYKIESFNHRSNVIDKHSFNLEQSGKVESAAAVAMLEHVNFGSESRLEHKGPAIIKQERDGAHPHERSFASSSGALPAIVAAPPVVDGADTKLQPKTLTKCRQALTTLSNLKLKLLEGMQEDPSATAKEYHQKMSNDIKRVHAMYQD